MTPEKILQTLRKEIMELRNDHQKQINALVEKGRGHDANEAMLHRRLIALESKVGVSQEAE